MYVICYMWSVSHQVWQTAVYERVKWLLELWYEAVLVRQCKLLQSDPPGHCPVAHSVLL